MINQRKSSRWCRGKRAGGPVFRKRKDSRGTAYPKRDAILLSMGFASYGDYLKSSLWKAIRFAKVSADPCCEICLASKVQHVHHIAYNLQTLKGKHRRKLVSVCADCHHKIEFRPDGTKRNFEGAMKKTRKMLRRNNLWHLHKRNRVTGLAPAEPTKPLEQTAQN